MNGPEQRPLLVQPAGLNARTVRLLRVLLLAAVTAVFGLLYLLSAEFRSETNRALGILGRGDIAGLRDYILSFGLWAPVASCFLMVLQALVAPVPSFLITFANGLAFGVFWGWMLSLFGHVLAAAVCFWISRALGRVPVEVLVGKTGLESADRWFARWGVYAVFAGRLVPGAPGARVCRPVPGDLGSRGPRGRSGRRYQVQEGTPQAQTEPELANR